MYLLPYNQIHSVSKFHEHHAVKERERINTLSMLLELSSWSLHKIVVNMWLGFKQNSHYNSSYIEVTQINLTQIFT